MKIQEQKISKLHFIQEITSLQDRNPAHPILKYLSFLLDLVVDAQIVVVVLLIIEISMLSHFQAQLRIYIHNHALGHEYFQGRNLLLEAERAVGNRKEALDSLSLGGGGCQLELLFSFHREIFIFFGLHLGRLIFLVLVYFFC